MGMRRKLAAMAAMATAAVAAIAFSVGPARADTMINAVYPVSGSTHINSTNSDLTLGPGTLNSTIDLQTLQLTGDVSLPPSSGSFNAFGFVPVSATVAFVPVGQTTGAVTTGAITDGTVTATSQFIIQITSMTVAGLPAAPGSSCETSSPVAITVTSPANFNADLGGTLTGTYTIPDFKSCGPLGIETPLINALIPGSGNTISLTLGKPTLSRAS
jgi:hypothetical protein